MNCPMHVQSNPNFSGSLFVALSALCASTLAIFAKFSLMGGVTLETLLSVRFVGAAAVFWGVVFFRKEKVEHISWRQILLMLIVGAVGFSAASTFYVVSLSYIPVSLMIILIYLYPVWVMMMGVLFQGEPLNRMRLLALVFAIVGTAFVAGSPSGDIRVTGIYTALMASFCFGLYIFFSNRVIQNIPIIVSSAYVTLGAAISCTTGTLCMGAFSVHFQPIAWWYLSGLILISTVLQVVLFFLGLLRVGPSKAAILSTLEPLLTILLAVVFLNESLEFHHIFGGFFILAAVYILRRA